MLQEFLENDGGIYMPETAADNTLIAVFDDRTKIPRIRVIGDLKRSTIDAVREHHELYTYGPREGDHSGQMSQAASDEESGKRWLAEIVPTLSKYGHNIEYRGIAIQAKRPGKDVPTETIIDPTTDADDKTLLAVFDDRGNLPRMRVVGNLTSETIDKILEKNSSLYTYGAKEGKNDGQISLLAETEAKGKEWLASITPILESRGYSVKYRGLASELMKKTDH